MPSGDKNFERSQQKALTYKNVNAFDFVRKDKRLFFKTSCSSCGADRGYMPLKSAGTPYCMKCMPYGQYERTDFHRQISSENVKGARVGKLHSEVTKQLLSQKQEAYCKKHGNQFKGRQHSLETRASLSATNSHQKPQWKGRVFEYFGTQGCFKLRSSWELAFAHWLDAYGIFWEYEPKYKLSNGMTYSPDFKLEDSSIIEIKGYWTDKAKLKFQILKSDYPNLDIEVLEQQELINLGIIKGT